MENNVKEGLLCNKEALAMWEEKKVVYKTMQSMISLFYLPLQRGKKDRGFL